MRVDIQSLKEELVRISRKAYERGLVSGAGGNISVRIPGTGLALITATGISLGDTAPDNLVTIEIETNRQVDECGYRPSKETGFHMEVYKLRPEVNAIVHVHPPYATAFSMSGEDLPLVTISAEANLRRVPCIEFAPSGSIELRNHVANKVRECPEARAFLMKRHGILTLGPNLIVAYNLSDLVEDTAKVAFLMAQLRLPVPR